MTRITLSPTAPEIRPRSVSLAFAAVVVALLCGIAEMLLRGVAGPGAVLARLTIYGLVLAAAMWMAAGARWARTLLAVGLGTIGLVSLLAEPLTGLAANGFGELRGTPVDAATAMLRTAHVFAVLTMLAALSRADARRYFVRTRK
ncbi:hypothetical protein NDR87_05815 [Nocardia sp. CDC159]|uniref:Uncharacterized protein n=1 Tax=Nocardia pulmonis TaxID=2951408 RepID=A0A9X2IV34_9NOCA|nr:MULTISPECIES: hypothetical protein [Nocardia]MCM6772823.1 hypothetical protein [Nocardia pulmonis]MCM6785874.1 hypothetical protein [Nocardia sp. CDC159]